MSDRICLREFTDGDEALFAEWLNKPHVRPWFNPESWLMEIRLRKSEFSFIRHFIAECDGKPIGFVQYYNYALGGEDFHGSRDVRDTYSLDYLIGEEEYLKKRLAPKMLAALEEKIRRETKARQIIVQPEPDNAAARATLNASGYIHDEGNDVFYKMI